MPVTHGSTKSIVLMLVLGQGLYSCSKAFNTKADAKKDPVVSDTDGGEFSGASVSKSFEKGVVLMDWQHSDQKVYSSGKGATVLSTYKEAFPHIYCFENTRHRHDCLKASSSVRQVVQAEPVAIQGFQLNFTKRSHNASNAAYESVVLEGATVSTAELRFNTASGEMSLYNHRTRLVHGQSCNLSDKSGMTVGYYNPKRVMTGLYLMEEYLVNSAAYTDGHFTSANILYSGLVPDPEVGNIFRWRFERPDEAAETTMGLVSFSEQSNSSVAASNYFGVSSSDGVSRWDSHVITGWCIRGYKTERISGQSKQRPLIHLAEIRTHEPKLIFQSSSRTAASE